MNRAITQARLLFQRRPASRFHPAAPNHVSIPDDWNEQEDLEYFQQNMCIEGTDDTLNVVLNDLENFRGVLTFAYCFLTGQPYEPYDSCVFQNLPVRSKVGLLRKLLRNRNLDAKCVATGFPPQVKSGRVGGAGKGGLRHTGRIASEEKRLEVRAARESELPDDLCPAGNRHAREIRAGIKYALGNPGNPRGPRI